MLDSDGTNLHRGPMMQGHYGHGVRGLAVHPNNPDQFASAGADRTVRVWSKSERRMVCSELHLAHDERFSVLQASPNVSQLACCSSCRTARAGEARMGRDTHGKRSVFSDFRVTLAHHRRMCASFVLMHAIKCCCITNASHSSADQDVRPGYPCSMRLL